MILICFFSLHISFKHALQSKQTHHLGRVLKTQYLKFTAVLVR